jgi:hypothetical protein
VEGGAYQTTTARLENISRGGAVVEADALPPRDGSVWICSPGSGNEGWVEAELRPAMIRPRGPHRLRLVFRDRAGTEPFFRWAAFGGDPVGPGSDREPATPNAPAMLGPSADALETLGLSWPCSMAQARGAYHRLALQVHPDHGGTPEDFIRLQFAYRAVIDRCESAPKARPGSPSR